MYLLEVDSGNLVDELKRRGISEIRVFKRIVNITPDYVRMELLGTVIDRKDDVKIQCLIAFAGEVPKYVRQAKEKSDWLDDKWKEFDERMIKAGVESLKGEWIGKVEEVKG